MNESHAVTGRGMKLSVAAMVAALVSLLAFAPLASAASDPLASGTTTIKINSGLYKKLKKSGVKVLGVKPATARKANVTLPVSGGELDPLTGKGVVDHSGGVKLKRGRKAVVLSSIVVDTTKKSLSAKLGAKTLKVATLLGVSFKRDGFGVDVSVRKLKLTAKVAKLLDRKLGVRAFKANANLGSSSSATQPSTVTITGGNAALSASLPTVAKLMKDNVQIELVPPTTLSVTGPPPTFAFPVNGGTISPAATSGVVHTAGGLKLVQDWTKFGAGKTTMTLNAIWVDLGVKTASVEVIVESTVDPKLNLGNLSRSSIADVSLVGATVISEPSAHKVTLKNASATLQAVTAETLNSVFATPFEAITKTPAEKFAAGDPLGTFEIAAQTQ